MTKASGSVQRAHGPVVSRERVIEIEGTVLTAAEIRRALAEGVTRAIQRAVVAALMRREDRCG